MSVVLLLQSLCQPHGDAAKFWGFTRVSKPCRRVCLVIGKTRYYLSCREHAPLPLSHQRTRPTDA